jgi:Coenzyme PQQ synthesis protein D (PqqD)
MADESQAKEGRMLDAVAQVPEHVVHRSFEAETLLLNLETGQYHGLNETGGRMLELLEAAQGRVREAVEKLADEYQVAFSDIAPDLIAFCSDLETRGLLVVERDSA